LPVSLLPFDDRIEKPEGVVPRVIHQDHPITQGLDEEWPYLLGFNEVIAKKDSEVLAMVGEYPLLVIRSFGKGRSVAWTSDIGPHWCPKDFVEWTGYARLWQQIVAWATGASS
jgi:uncharacterized membrane protein